MTEEQLSPAQLAAIRRREKILSNTGNRMNLVTGKDEQLQQAPEPLATSVADGSPRAKISTGLKYRQNASAAVRIFKWPVKILMALFFSCFLIVLIDISWLSVKFVVCFALLEMIFGVFCWFRNSKNAQIRKTLDVLFVADNYDNGVDEYLQLAVIFLELKGGVARHFRSLVFYGMQIFADFAVFSTVFLLCSLFKVKS